MTKPYLKPEGEEVRSAKWVVPLAALAAIAIAVLIGSFFIHNDNSNQQAANPANHSSATGLSSGEAGRDSTNSSPDATSNARAAPGTKEQPASGQ